MTTRLHYGWFVAAVTFVALVTCAGIRAVPTMFIIPLGSEFAWSRSAISAAIALNIILYGLMGPFAAALMNRMGLRRTMLCALSLLALATGLSTIMRAEWQLFALWGVLVGIGTGTVSLTLAATVLERWFEERRGLLMGIFSAAGATGQLAFLPLFGYLVTSFGWRACALLVCAVCLSLVPLVALVVRDYPIQKGIAPFGARALRDMPQFAGNPFAAAIDGLRSGVRSRDFWLLAASFFVCGASTNGMIGTHFVPASHDHGIPANAAAGLLAAMGIFDLAGTTLSGWLTDRMRSQWLLFWYYGLRGLALLFLPFAFGSHVFGLPIFVMFYGLDWIATVPPTLRLTASTFGRDRAPLMFGWIMAVHQVGASVAAFGAGALREHLGSYDPSFAIAGALCALTALVVLQIGRAPIAVRATS